VLTTTITFDVEYNSDGIPAVEEETFVIWYVVYAPGE
jgi:hypothetical protein